MIKEFFKKSKHDKLKIINYVQLVLVIITIVLAIYIFKESFPFGDTSLFIDIISDAVLILLLITEAYRFVLVDTGIKLIIIINVFILIIFFSTDIEYPFGKYILIYVLISTLLTHIVKSDEKNNKKITNKKKK